MKIPIQKIEEAALEIMGKLHALLGQISESADTDPKRKKH